MTSSKNVIGNVNDEPKTLEGRRNIWLILVPLVLYMGWMLFSTFYASIRYTELWNELRDRSTAHDVIVGAYRDCRNKPFINSSVSECLVVASDYGKIKGYEGNLAQVLAEIQEISNDIENGKL